MCSRTSVSPPGRTLPLWRWSKRGLGVSILPDLILQRIPYRIEVRSLQQPYYRPIVLAMKQQAHLTPAVQKFIEYLPLREAQR